jgi:heme/copper-type cytochrome/quinol oxidase subunit 4
MKNKKLWINTRISFWLMVAFWMAASLVLSVNEESTTGLMLSVIACGLVISTFVMSILHLRTYKQKGFAVTALVISSMGILFMLLGALSV